MPIRKRILNFFIKCQILVLFLPSILIAQDIKSHNEKVILQLKWTHQFQFAGYYMAKEKGIYDKYGLDVMFKEGIVGVQPHLEVLEKRADFGIAMTELLVYKSMGQSFVALASILQHSPAAIVARKDRGILNAYDIAGKTVMLNQGLTDTDITAMLRTYGIGPKDFIQLPNTHNIEDLIHSKVDAMYVYLTNEGYTLEKRGIDYTTILPQDAGIDFYSDILFTTEEYIRDNPTTVNNFIQASLEGWQYAMLNPDETIKTILDKYNSSKSYEALDYEYRYMKRLMLPEIIEIGHMSRKRWESIYSIYQELNFLQGEVDLDEFIYEPSKFTQNTIINVIIIIGSFFSLVVIYFLYKTVVDRQIKQVVKKRTKELSELNERLEFELSEKRKTEKELSSHNNLFNSIIQNPDNLYLHTLDKNYRLTFYNDNFKKLIKVLYNSEISKSRPIYSFMKKEDFDELRVYYDKALMGSSYKTTIKRSTLNTDFYFELLLNPIISKDGSIENITIFALEVTDKIKAREEIENNEQKYRQLFEAVTEAVFIIDDEGKIIDSNKRAFEVFRMSRYEIIGRFPSDLSPEFQPNGRKSIGYALDLIKKALSGEPQQFEWVHKKGDGSIFDAEIGLNVMEMFSRKYLIASIRDISEQKRDKKVQQVLYNIANAVNLTRNLEELFILIRVYLSETIDTTNFFIAIYDGKTDTITIPYLIDQFDKYMSFPAGKTLTKYVIKTGKTLFGTEELVRELEERGEVELIGTPSNIWVGIPLKVDRSVMGVLVVQSYSTNVIYTEKDVELLEFVSDQIALAIERKRNEEILAQEKERLAVTLRSIGDGVITTDTQGHVIMLNKLAEEYTEWTNRDAHLKPLEDIFKIISDKTGEELDNPVKEVLKSGDIVSGTYDTVLVSQSGRKRIISETASPIRDNESRIIGVVLVFRDITEKQRMETEILRTRKLDSVGLLAGGIAHDFNNLLTVILGNLMLTKKFAEKIAPKLVEKLERAEKASVRAKDLTQQLLTFSKGGAPVKKLADLKEIIVDTAEFVSRGSNVRLEMQLPDNLWTVEVDDGQFSQVINNLVINAIQAMSDGGTLRISAENFITDGIDYINLRAGTYIKVTVADEGTGIDVKNLEKVFDPYFTTKQKGHGLGLASSYSIIKKHGGTIDVSSTLGKGTTFYIYLPSKDTKIELTKDNKAVIEKGYGRILIMDDEEFVVQVCSDMLTSLGYEVSSAPNGSVALEKYRLEKEAGKPYDLVIMDLTIPGGMGGRETIMKMLEYDKDAKVIVASGYSNDDALANYPEYGFKAAIKKPFIFEELAQTVKEVIREK